MRWHGFLKNTDHRNLGATDPIRKHRHFQLTLPGDGGPPLEAWELGGRVEGGGGRSFAKITTGIKYSSLSPGGRDQRPLAMSRAKERLKGGKETKDSVTLLPCFYFVEVNISIFYFVEVNMYILFCRG